MLDTNVMVSALLRPGSVPAQVLDLVLGRQVTLALDHRIFAVYQDVLYRTEFMFPRDRVADLLEFLWRSSERIYAEPLPIRLPDPDDLKFIEVAVSALADALVTGNLRHFPVRQRHGVRVLTPRQWLEFWAGTLR
ncbi:MAG: putative toxin-antitoxin system toxin component, PIN family [Candidatus Binatia bacterium]